MTHKRNKKDLVVGDRCRVKDAPPAIDCEGIKNGSLCVVKKIKPHTLYVKIKGEKELYPIYPCFLVRIKDKKSKVRA